MAERIVSDAERVSMAVLEEAAMPHIVETCKKLVADEIARWVYDPEVEGVTGLTVVGEPRRALVAVYLNDDDFETSLEFEQFSAHY